MPDLNTRRLFEKWEVLSKHLDENEATDSDMETMRALLRDSTAAGATTLEGGKRAELQWLARQIADAIFGLTGNYPDALILPCIETPSTVSSEANIPQRAENEVHKTGGRWRLVRTLIALSLFGFLIATVFAALFFVGKQEQAALKTRIDQQTAIVSGLQADLEAEQKKSKSEQTDLQDKLTVEKNNALLLVGVVASIEKTMMDFAKDLPDDQLLKYVVENCLRLIRQSQLKNNEAGAFRVTASGDPVWIRADWGNQAALALLAVHTRYPGRADRAADLQAVMAWIQWYAKNQNPETGTILEMEGRISTGLHKINDRPQACSPSYFLVLERYYSLAKEKPTDEILIVAQIALKAMIVQVDYLQASLQDDNNPPCETFFIPCVENYGGLKAAARFFDRAGKNDEANEAQAAADRLAPLLKEFWRPEEELFASKVKNNKFTVTLVSLSPDVLSNLYGLAWVSSKEKGPWKKITQGGFKPDQGHLVPRTAAEAPVEWWLIASSRAVDGNNLKERRALALREAATFNESNTYLCRSAVMLLAILEEAKWLPSIEPRDNPP